MKNTANKNSFMMLSMFLKTKAGLENDHQILNLFGDGDEILTA